MRILRPATQFATIAQQGEVAHLGIWVFLATEIMFFGALIFTYVTYRHLHPVDFAAAAAHTELWCGTVNAVLLLTSSLTMVLGIDACTAGRRRIAVRWLAATILLGLGFLGVKSYEYVADYHEQVVPALNFIFRHGEHPPAELFWVFYFIATLLHAVHMTIGLGLVLYMTYRVCRGDFTRFYRAPLEVVGLYWSFVDTVWIFLFPMLYLNGRS
ncbi:MAG: cytochrome c oxidase subunit 3 [Alphaproteobacteria bacterium]|nr:cytochrome c oxidase subunit 3 [Alphaproteobacteria bacterium]